MRQATPTSRQSAASKHVKARAVSPRSKRAHVLKGAAGARRASSPDLPRKLPRQPRAHETVKAILQAAAKLIAEQGFALMTTNKIAERAGVSIGSLYQYFPNKTAILTSLLEEHQAGIQPVIEQSMRELEDPKLAFSEAIRRLFVRLLEKHAVHPRLNRVLAEEVPRTRRAIALDRHNEEAYVNRVVEILRKRRDTRVAHPIAMAHILFQATQALTRWLAHTPPEIHIREACIDEAVKMLSVYVQERRRRSAG
ncbi:MAG: TetR/AcrR family transcriptional regulator [Vicinamibacteria bacterium]|nr:TetR/AcrR family transcriptional regulator [Vicinamibacteria bacterium]